MRSGRLRHRITVESQSDDSGSFGEELEVYNKVFNAKCNFKVLSGTELVKAGVELNREIASLLMRYDSRLQYDHLILFKGVRYEVSTIKPDDKNKDMIVTVSRQVY